LICDKDTVPQNSSLPYLWEINGKPDFISFSETISNSFPVFLKFNLLPDTIKRHDTLFLRTDGVNYNSISMDVRTGAGVNDYYYLSHAYSGFYAAVASPTFLPTSSTATLNLGYEKAYSKLIQDTQVFFSMRSLYRKKIIITD
jgi:hypothetical protein